jgi:hypothetical protein
MTISYGLAIRACLGCHQHTDHCSRGRAGTILSRIFGSSRSCRDGRSPRAAAFLWRVTQRSNAFGKVECAQREATRAFALPIKRVISLSHSDARAHVCKSWWSRHPNVRATLARCVCLPPLEQMRSKRMPQRVRRNRLCDLCSQRRALHQLLNAAHIQMMPPDLFRPGIFREIRRRSCNSRRQIR